MRALRTLALLLLVASTLTGRATAAEPASGTLSSSSGPLLWTGGPFLTSNLAPGCNPVFIDGVCDRFLLTVDAAEGSPVRVQVTSDDADAQFLIQIRTADGDVVGSAFSTEPDAAIVFVHRSGYGSPYDVRVTPRRVGPETTYSGLAELAGTLVDPDNPECSEFVPHRVGLETTDDGRRVELSVRVLLDPRPFPAVDLLPVATEALEEAKAAYEPLGIDLTATFERVSFSGRVSTDLIRQARDHFGGQRPAGADIVYVATNKDIVGSDGDSAVAGQADCIGGVEHAARAFAVGELPSFGIRAAGFDLSPSLPAIVVAHEIGHLMGAHHHYATCGEGDLTAVTQNELTVCTVMFPTVFSMDLNFSTLNGRVTRSHAFIYAQP